MAKLPMCPQVQQPRACYGCIEYDHCPASPADRGRCLVWFPAVILVYAIFWIGWRAVEALLK